MLNQLKNFIFAIVMVFLSSTASTQDCTEYPDFDALMAFYESTDGQNWTNNNGWIDGAVASDCNYCEWYGVTCNANNRVTKLQLKDNNLGGNIAPEIGDITTIATLDLRNNSIGGDFPAEIANISNLRNLWVESNLLTGNLPSNIGDLVKLKQIRIRYNLMSGELPNSLANCTELLHFWVNHNSFTGAIPPFELWPNIRTIYAHYNQLTGSLVESANYANQSSLTHIYFHNNDIVSNIPNTFSDFPSLKRLYLLNNVINGNIPSDLGNILSFQYLRLENNNLTGEIPSSLGSLPNLLELRLQGNQLSGSIPASLGLLPKLTQLRLHNNQLTGEIPSDLGAINTLIYFSAYNNELTGEIPFELATLGAITTLDLRNNELVGCIPLEFQSFCGSNANVALTGNNDLSDNGDFTSFCNGNPCEFCSDGIENYDEIGVDCGGECGECMLTISLDGTNETCSGNDGSLNVSIIEGNEPYTYAWSNGSNSPSLSLVPADTYSVTVTDNAGSTAEQNLTIVNELCDCSPGTVCPSFPDYEALMAIYCATDGPDWTDNSGWIDGAAGTDCDYCDWKGVTCNANGRVWRILMLNNNLNGSIPSQIGDLNELEILNLSQNNLSGVFPVEITDLSLLYALLLSDNELSGFLPDNLGDLNLLTLFEIRNNNLSGNIPSSINNLDFTRFDVSYNQFTGTYPPFHKWNSIEIFNITENNFTGSLPDNGEYQNLINLEFLRLGNNQISGNLPVSISELTNIKTLALNSNNFNGLIPSEYANFTTITQLFLSHNDLDGCIPEKFMTYCNSSVYVTFSGNEDLSHDANFNNFCTGAPCDFCSDGLENYGETGVDCGGSCEDCATSDCSNYPDLDALLALYNNTGGDQNWSIKTGWEDGAAGTDCNYCNWFGVVCDANNRVVEISLSENNLSGNLPNEISQLTELKLLNLNENGLSSPLNSSLFDIISLEKLYLADNNLTGIIPSEIGNLTNLKTFFAGNNNFANPIPVELANCQNLESLYLDNCNFSEAGIPSTLLDFPNLITLDISNNDFYGDLTTTDFSGVPALASFNIAFCNFAGILPSSLSAASNLEFINFSGNDFSGLIPSVYGGFNSMFIMNMTYNNLSGCIPTSFDTYCISNANIQFYGNDQLSHGANFSNFCNGDDCEFPDTCNDGIPNGDEVGTDCGGSCPACEDLTASFFSSETECNLSTGIATVSVSGGTEPYMYAWDNGETTSSISDLAAGTYTVTVTDQNSDTASGSVDVIENCNNSTIDFDITIFDVNSFELSENDLPSLAPGQTGYVNVEITNIGSTPTESTQISIILSQDEELLVLESVGSENIINPLGPNESISFEMEINIDVETLPDFYKLYALVDPFNLQIEIDDDINNKEYIDIEIIDSHCYNGTADGDETEEDCGGSCPPCFVDLEFTELSILSAPTIGGDPIEISIVVTNVGGVTSEEESFTSRIGFYLSLDPNPDYSNDLDLLNHMLPSLDPGESYSTTITLITPEDIDANNYFLKGFADIYEINNEINIPNNVYISDSFPIEVNPCFNGVQNEDLGETGIDCGGECCTCLVDLEFTSLEFLNTQPIQSSQFITLNYRITNISQFDSKFQRISFYLSESPNHDDPKDLIARRLLTNTIGPYSFIDGNLTFNLDNSISSSLQNYFIIAEVENSKESYTYHPSGIVPQFNLEEDKVYENNFLSTPVAITSDSCCNGVKDNGENGIDCGGICPPCPEEVIWPDHYADKFEEGDLDREININLEVGRTKGQASVTSAGGAAYTIPIQVPPGIQGMKPNISLNYNSQGGNGSLGVGWGLSCSSTISRSNKSQYYDEEYREIRLDIEDPYALDGNRLLVSNGQIGQLNSEYKLETENYSIITYKLDQETGLDFFELKTKQGIISEYGNTGDSRCNGDLVQDQDKVIFWRLNESKDPYGNYIKYEYSKYGRELLLDKVIYAGNENGVAPQVEVNFEYMERGDKSKTYVCGNTLEQNMLLTSIQIVSEGRVFKTYNIGYSYKDKDNVPKANSHSVSYLQEVQESGESILGTEGLKLNSTIFKYDETISTVLSTPNIDYKTKPIVGDFNGDGISDIFTADLGTIGTTGFPTNNNDQLPKFPHFYAGQPDGTFLDLGAGVGESAFFVPQFEALPGFFDFNADGINEIVVPYFNVDNGNLSKFTALQIGESFTIETFETDTELRRSLPGDFDGDGLLDILNLIKTGNNTVNLSLISSQGPISIPISNEIGNTNFFNWQKFASIKVGDFNGDGVSDLLYTSQDYGTQIYDVHIDDEAETGMLTPMSNQGDKSSVNLPIPTPVSYFDVADFNGDGKSDIIFSDNGCLWNIAYSNGYEFVDPTNFQFEESYPPKLEYNLELRALKLEKGYNISLADFNNDGKQDIAYLPSYGVSNSNEELIEGVSIYHSTGLGFNKIVEKKAITSEPILVEVAGQAVSCCHDTHSWVNELIPGDFNGDGNLDIIIDTYLYDHDEEIPDYDKDVVNLNFIDGTHFLAPNRSLHVLTLNKNASLHKLTDVVDGFNYKTEFSYNTLCNTGSYTNNENTIVNGVNLDAYPLRTMTVPLSIVTKLKTDDGNNGITNTSYLYEDATFHLQGKGFLGFHKSTTLDIINNRKVTNEFSFNSERFTFLPFLSGTQLIFGDETISSQVTYYDVVPKDYGGFDMRLGSTILTDHINKRKSYRVYIYDEFRNIEKETITTSGLDFTGDEALDHKFEKSVVENINYVNNGSYIPNKPITTRVTKTRKDRLPYVKTTQREYNDQGSIISLTEFKGTDKEFTVSIPEGYIDICGNALRKIQSSPDPTAPTKTVDYEFDLSYRFNISTTNVDFNQKESQTYDPLWGKTLTANEVISLDNPNANTPPTTFTYDEFGRVKTNSNQGRHSTTYSYKWNQEDPIGIYSENQISNAMYLITSENDGTATKKAYFDNFDREIMTTIQDFGGVLKSFTNYDQRGRKVVSSNGFRSSADLIETSYEYDELNRMLSATTTDLGQITHTYTSNEEGTLITQTTHLDQKEDSQFIDFTGKTIKSIDSGNGITEYKYHSNNQIKEVLVNSISNTVIEYDYAGRKREMTNADSGINKYNYNAYGLLVEYIDAENRKTTNNYDLLDRIDDSTLPEGTIDYIYYNDGNGINQIKDIIGHDGTTENYLYDDYRRLESKTEVINGEPFTHSYTFDDWNRIKTETYPSNYTITNNYDDIGTLLTIFGGNEKLYELDSDVYTATTKTLKYTLGNQQQTTVVKDQFGYLERISTEFASVFDMQYDFNILNGNLNNREDHIANLTEQFLYDDHHRLESSTIEGKGPFTTSYLENGNIDVKSDVSGSSYLYNHATKFHAVTGVENVIASTNIGTENIQYNSFQQPVTISEGCYNLTYQYAPDQNRRYAKMLKNLAGVAEPELVYERYYCGNYELNKTPNSTHQIHYIGNGIIGVIEGENGPMDIYYSYTDYLGSILAITDNQGNVINRYNYDSWGRERDANSWEYKNSTENNLSWLYRGYTGHEMLPEFDLINMNGRLYDPVIGRMLSPDNNAGFDGTSQSHNRYSYALNNPLKYTDPDGELPILASVLIAYQFDVMFNDGKGGWNAVAFGAASAFVGFGIGNLFIEGAVFAGISGSIGGELVSAGLHGISAGLFSEISGGNFGSGFASGALSSGLGSLTQGIKGGWFISGVGGGLISSEISGGDPLLSVTQGLIINLANHEMHIDQTASLPTKDGPDPGIGIGQALEREFWKGVEDRAAFRLSSDQALRELRYSSTGSINSVPFFFEIISMGAGKIASFVRSAATTFDGFLFKGFTVQAPFDIPVQRFGNMSLSRNDFWGPRIGTSRFANRVFGAIKPNWNPLTQYTKGIIPKGTPMKFGLIGPQGWKHPGGSLQFITNSRDVINQSSKIIP